MNFIGDFHIHSNYSLATSIELAPEYLDYYARLKGIRVVGTGDFTHPEWLAEVSEKLEPAEEGLFRLKKEYSIPLDIPGTEDVRFILTTEISSIYKQGGKVRKIHNIIFAPGFDAARSLQDKMVKKGFNITSDGRPIIGMDARNLLDMALSCSDRVFFVPAHIWTPWFSLLGEKSGFDSVEECFGDLAGNIYAVETGLSTDPPMNRICSILDRYTLIANSDAHSPEKLGRNANLFNTGLSYNEIIHAMMTGDPEKFKGTIDFFPQEGKYHYDGHRKCNVCWDPLETIKNMAICPVCRKPVVTGVLNRVAQLADRNISGFEKMLPFISLIPLKELLSNLENTAPGSKKVDRIYRQLLHSLGPELRILTDIPFPEIEKVAGENLARAIQRMRNRQVTVSCGYDGEYGRVDVSSDPENSPDPLPLLGFDVEAFKQLAGKTGKIKPEQSQMRMEFGE